MSTIANIQLVGTIVPRYWLGSEHVDFGRRAFSVAGPT